MLEKDMEELIALYPAEFFPRNDFTLVGRQGSFSGVGRYDLLFEDARRTTILMELKARPAKYADADQLAKYNDALRSSGQKGIVLWLVAPNIPHAIREFLDNIGIEYTEIHVAEYQRIAEKHGYAASGSEEPMVDTHVAASGASRPRPDRAVDAGCGSRVLPIFASRVEQLAGVSDAGYRFLRDLGDNRIPSFYLWTATNAHLYYKDGYYCYIVPDKDELKIRGRFNTRIKSGAADNHDRILPVRVRALIQQLDGFKGGWAKERGEWFILGNSTPTEFFDGLLELIRTTGSGGPGE